MRCATHVRNNQFTIWLVAGLVFVMGFNVLLVQAARAVDTQINVEICNGSSSASLALTTPLPGSVHATSPIRTQGSINRLSQITVFVDGAYNSTIPIDSGASSFIYDVSLAPGTHTVRYVGADSCQATSPVAEISITFDPSVITEPTTGQESPSQPQQKAESGVRIGSTLPTQESLSKTQPITAFSNFIYSALIVLDFANSTSFESVSVMSQRFAVFSTGLILLFLSRPMLIFYRTLRYRVLKMRKRPMPEFLRARPITWIRSAGIALLLSLFIFMI